MTLPFCQLLVLVAEHDRASQLLMTRTLGKMGMAVVPASNGKEALARFGDDRFDMIFMDLELPEMDGFATAAAILRHEKASDDDDHVPIIAMTTLARSCERDLCLAAGMDSYMEKPVSPRQLQVALLAFANPDLLLPTRPPPKWDRVRALERIGGDEGLLAELIAIFAEEKASILRRMDAALLERKPELLRKAAHDLEEELNYLGASEDSEIARKLGVTANQTDFVKAAEIAALLRFQLSTTDAAMSRN